MFIIFGWGHTKVRNFGALVARLCDNCHNHSAWVLLSRSVWFTLFFIPVFPYERDHFLLCPICQHGLKLTDAQFKTLKEAAENKGQQAPAGATADAPATDAAAAPSVATAAIANGNTENGSPIVSR